MALLAVFLVFAMSSREQRIYAATTKLLVNQKRGSLGTPTQTMDDLRVGSLLVYTVMELMHARPVVSEATERLGLGPRYSVRLTTTPIADTQLFNLTVQDPDPERAAAIANEIVLVFMSKEGELIDNPFDRESSVVIIEPAQPQRKPVSPNPQRNALLLGMVASFLAMAIGFLIDFFNTKMKTEADMRRMSGLVPLDSIGVLRGNSPQEKLVVAREVFSPDAETYRMMRTHIDTFPLGRTIRSIAVTSGSPRDGKSTTAANLAVALAQTGRRVILIDTDLRSSTLHQYFGLPNTAGVTEVLSGSEPSALPLLQETSLPNLRLLSGGAFSQTPSLLIGSPTLEAMTEELKSAADLLIFDTPSLLAVVDATLLMRTCDVALLVARAQATRADTLKRAYAQLQQSGMSILGVLFNAVPKPGLKDKYYYQRLWRRLAKNTPKSSFALANDRPHNGATQGD